ncbi:MAG: hypothetical protein FJ164_15250 [Gammaproteobacteria bacterium]|nr:hypothetical protein [Gammaproteobacteria bacterium]
MSLQRRKATPHRGWVHALLVLALLANLALTWHHYALAEHQAQETCHLCAAGSAPGHAPPALPGIPAVGLTQAAPTHTDSFTLPEALKGFHRARAPPSHPA